MELKTPKKESSDDVFDAVTAVLLIACAVIGIVYWLMGQPG